MNFATTEKVYPTCDKYSYLNEGILIKRGGKPFSFSPKTGIAVRKEAGSNVERYISAIRAMADQSYAPTEDAVYSDRKRSDYPVQVQAVPFYKKETSAKGWNGSPLPYIGRQMRDHKLMTVDGPTGSDKNLIYVGSTGGFTEKEHGFDSTKLIPLVMKV